jgi:hypothetical protein
MKEILIAGDSIDEEVEAFDSAGNEYSGDDGWTAKFRFMPRGGGSGSAFEIPCAWTGDAFRYQVASSQSASWTPDNYTWALVVTKTGLQVTLETGQAQVTPNPLTAATYDGRTQAEKALDDAKAALASFNATSGRVKSYSIAGRAMEFDSGSEILKLISFWELQVAKEARAKSIASGLGDPYRVYVRM